MEIAQARGEQGTDREQDLAGGTPLDVVAEAGVAELVVLLGALDVSGSEGELVMAALHLLQRLAHAEREAAAQVLVGEVGLVALAVEDALLLLAGKELVERPAQVDA